MHIVMYGYAWSYVFMYVCTVMYRYAWCTHVCMYLCMHVYIYICRCVCIVCIVMVYVYSYVWICLVMHVCFYVSMQMVTRAFVLSVSFSIWMYCCLVPGYVCLCDHIKYVFKRALSCVFRIRVRAYLCVRLDVRTQSYDAIFTCMFRSVTHFHISEFTCFLIACNYVSSALHARISWYATIGWRFGACVIFDLLLFWMWT